MSNVEFFAIPPGEPQWWPDVEYGVRLTNGHVDGPFVLLEYMQERLDRAHAYDKGAHMVRRAIGPWEAVS